VQLKQRVGKRWRELAIATSHVDLGIFKDLLTRGQLLGEQGADVLETLNPEGKLRQVFLDLDFSREKIDFFLRANLENVSVESWKGAPAARGVSGYIEADLQRGFVALDCPPDLALKYPQVYDDFMSYGCPRGKVAWLWKPEAKRVLVTSSPIAVEGDEGQGNAVLHLELPTRKEAGDPQMYLMVGLKNSHSRLKDRYLPSVLNDNLLSWLERAVGDGEVEEAGFIWRGSLLKQNDEGRSIQFYARVSDGELDYQQGWPPLTELQGLLVVDNTRVDAWIDHAKGGAADIGAAGISLRGAAAGPVLRISAEVTSRVENALAALAESPLSETIGRIARLDASGDSDIDLDLTIPLGSGAENGEYRVEADVTNGTLTIPNTSLQISALRGELLYDGADGLESQGIKGRFLGGDLVADITSTDGTTALNIKAHPQVAGMDDYLGPAADYLDGAMAVEGVLSIPRDFARQNFHLELTSDLRGVTIDLPAPLGKKAEQSAALTSHVEFAERSLMVRGAIAERAAIAMSFASGQLERGEIRLLAAEATLPQQPGLLIAGQLGTLVWEEWQPLISQGQESGAPVMELLPRLDLHFDDVAFSGFELGKTHLEGGADVDGDWGFDVEAERLAGRIGLAGSVRETLSLDLDYLKLPARPEEEETSVAQGPAEKDESLINLLPGDVPEMDFSVAALYRGDSALGNIAFNTRKIHQGVLIDNIRGQLNGIEIRPQPVAGADEEEVAAEMRWTHDGERHNTFFSGTLFTDNIESALAAWNIPAPLTSESSLFFAEIGWRGQPWDVSLLGLDGYLGFELKEGQFYRATGAATNTVFKLISLVNFDTWLRRLRFDFSDIFSGGVSFDRVEGGLLFREGRMSFDDPIVATMPSGKIRLMGNADLINELLDARLVATMPVGTNLPWVAGLLGGLPAAAGVFLTSKIFARQVDQLSSLSYTIEGSFDDPDIQVERIFTDPTRVPVSKADENPERE